MNKLYVILSNAGFTFEDTVVGGGRYITVNGLPNVHEALKGLNDLAASFVRRDLEQRGNRLFLTKFYLVEATPFRLIFDYGDLCQAFTLGYEFPYILDKERKLAYIYLSYEDYNKQLQNPDDYWRVVDVNGEVVPIPAIFDDEWYEHFYLGLPIIDDGIGLEGFSFDDINLN